MPASRPAVGLEAGEGSGVTVGFGVGLGAGGGVRVGEGTAVRVRVGRGDGAAVGGRVAWTVGVGLEQAHNDRRQIRMMTGALFIFLQR